MIMNIMSDMLKNLGISLRERRGERGRVGIGVGDGGVGGGGAGGGGGGGRLAGPDFDGEERVLDFLRGEVREVREWQAVG
jgi:hypothetical protein